MTVKVGIVGMGKIGGRHFHAYSRIDNVEIRGYCDIKNILLEEKSKASNAAVFHDADSLVASKDIDAVDVCVPTPYHHEIILKALENKKHVFCEKPLTHKLEYAKEIRRKAGNQDKIVMVGYLYRFHPSFELLHDILRNDVIGEPYYAIFRIGGRGGHRAWKHHKDEGGGAMLDMLTHMLDLALFYFGKPAEVELLFMDTLLAERFIDGEKVKASAEDCVFLRTNTEKGLQVFFEADMITPSFTNLVEVHGDNGSFIGSIMPRLPTILYLKEPRDIYDRGETVFNFPPTNLIEKELRHFIDCIVGSDAPQNSVEDSIKVLEVIEEVRRQRGG